MRPVKICSFRLDFLLVLKIEGHCESRNIFISLDLGLLEVSYCMLTY